jgi:predicted TIM-barrel fold metal-dependent hydrolase
MRPWMLSSDSHIFEPPDLWSSRVPAAYRDRAPRVEPAADADWWVFLDQRMCSFAAGTKAGLRFEGQDALKVEFHFSDIREGAYTPAVHVDDNAADGVWGSVLFPSIGVLLFQEHEPAALAAYARAYNEWIAEFCAAAPGRLKGMAIIDAENVDGAVGELEHAHGLGLAGAVITVAPLPGAGYEQRMYDPFWETAAGLGMPLSLHIATNRDGGQVGSLYTEAGVTNCDGAVRDSLARMIFSGVFERHPGLTVGAVEFEAGWVAHFLERMDYTYAQREHQEGWARFADGAVPSDFFRRNAFVSFQEDPVGIHCRHLIGVDCLLWGSDYPHTESTFPRSAEILDDILKGVPDDERTRIVQSNTARIYGFKPPAIDDVDGVDRATTERAGGS